MSETIYPIPLRDGSEVPTGSTVGWVNGNPVIYVGDRRVKISALTAVRALGLELPDIETLEYWSYDGVCESVLGDTVEPDGIDPCGSPSWLLVMGMI